MAGLSHWCEEKCELIVLSAHRCSSWPACLSC